jgi:outer membrane receptor protein involved in Fe transport
MKFGTCVATLLAGTALAGVPATVYAAEADVAAGEDPNAIIVTSQKIEQRAVDVPITLSVQTGERMRELGVTDIGELSNYVPGLNVQVQSANNPGFVIRGITSDSGSAQQGPRVTLYYNGIDISRSRGAYQGIYDLDRVEVVKGPQATLFGTAATIGAISFVSAKPQVGTSASLTGAYGNLKAYRVEGFVNAGNDVIAARIAGQWKKRDGYIENLAPGQDDLYAQDQLGLRGSLRYTPTTDFTADLTFTYDRQRNSGTPFLSKNLGSTSVNGLYDAAYLGGSPLSGEVLGADKLGLNRDVYDGNLTLSWDFSDGWNFTTVNGYRHFDALEVFDADGSAAWYLEFAERAKGWQASHEGRFTYSDDQWRASFGWNYFIEDSSQYVPLSSELGTYLQCSANLIPGLGCVAADNTVNAGRATSLLTGGAFTAVPYSSWYKNEGRNQSWSMFGDVTWKPAPALELTAGARVLIQSARCPGLWSAAAAAGGYRRADLLRPQVLRRDPSALQRTLSPDPRPQSLRDHFGGTPLAGGPALCCGRSGGRPGPHQVRDGLELRGGHQGHRGHVLRLAGRLLRQVQQFPGLGARRDDRRCPYRERGLGVQPGRRG